MGKTLIIGDVHGHYDKLVALLQKHQIIDAHLAWLPDDTTLVFIGDFFDRGPNGVDVIDLVIRLQHESRRCGGQVHAVLGNHDFSILSAYRFGQQVSGGPGGSFVEDWRLNGGQPSDLKRLTPRHTQWLLELPAMIALGDTLLLHADATFYMDYGLSIEEVNTVIKRILKQGDAAAWDKMLGAFGEHQAFLNMDIAHVRQFLNLYGKKRLIHGHTPIYSLTEVPPHMVTHALVYAEGLCVNVDGCLYAGGNGFIYELHP